uniref:ABC transporter F family member 1-like n=1 Tax=Tanacetum cinerariifolium TaxID=118510 RepID=A0A6L2NGF8_TANCI|nr:ABC transporter F family member 1-like [Tanacetum cinerariifolium]
MLAFEIFALPLVELHLPFQRDSGILWKLILLFPDLRVMVPFSNLITALAIVRNGVPKMKGLYSSSFMSKITKSVGASYVTGYFKVSSDVLFPCYLFSKDCFINKPPRFFKVVAGCYVSFFTPFFFPSGERNGIYVLGDREFSLFPYLYLFRSFVGREFLKKLEHFSHSIVDLLAFLENAIMVVEGEVLNDFPRFVGILIAEFTAGGAIEILHDVVGTSGYHCGVLQSSPMEIIEQGNEEAVVRSCLAGQDDGGGEAHNRICQGLDVVDASTAERLAAKDLNGLGFNKQMQAKKTIDFSESAYYFEKFPRMEEVIVSPPVHEKLLLGSLSHIKRTGEEGFRQKDKVLKSLEAKVQLYPLIRRR